MANILFGFPNTIVKEDSDESLSDDEPEDTVHINYKAVPSPNLIVQIAPRNDFFIFTDQGVSFTVSLKEGAAESRYMDHFEKR